MTRSRQPGGRRAAAALGPHPGVGGGDERQRKVPRVELPLPLVGVVVVELQPDHLLVELANPRLELGHGEQARAVAAEERGGAAGAVDGAVAHLEARAELLVVAGGVALRACACARARSQGLGDVCRAHTSGTGGRRQGGGGGGLACRVRDLSTRIMVLNSSTSSAPLPSASNIRNAACVDQKRPSKRRGPRQRAR